MPEELNEGTLAMVAERFRILGDPSRLRLLHALGMDEATVAELTERTGSTQATVSKQLGVLLRGGLVQRRKEGLYVFYRVSDTGVFRLCNLVCGSLTERLTRDLTVLRRSSKRRASR
jgi:ArsR family transcriptional regulator